MGSSRSSFFARKQDKIACEEPAFAARVHLASEEFLSPFFLVLNGKLAARGGDQNKVCQNSFLVRVATI